MKSRSMKKVFLFNRVTPYDPPTSRNPVKTLVVIAASEDLARKIAYKWEREDHWLSNANCKLIGIAKKSQKPGVVCTELLCAI